MEQGFLDPTLKGNESIEDAIHWGESLFLDKDLLALALTPGMERFS